MSWNCLISMEEWFFGEGGVCSLVNAVEMSEQPHLYPGLSIAYSLQTCENSDFRISSSPFTYFFLFQKRKKWA